MADLYDRAVVVLGRAGHGVRWPYGMEPLGYRERRRDPEGYEQRAAEMQARQEVIVAWAERHGLRLSPVGCCPLWLGRTTSRRCTADWGSQCTRHGSPSPDRGWLDHAVTWLKGSRPAAITSAPYYIGPEDEQRLEYWQQQADPQLQVVRGTGWYGFTTTQIVMWRTDRIQLVEAAEGSVVPGPRLEAAAVRGPAVPEGTLLEVDAVEFTGHEGS